MATYSIHVRVPFRSPAGRDLETYETEFIIQDPPQPQASLAINLNRYGRSLRIPVTIPTVDASGEPLPDGTRFELDWPGGVEVPPDHTELATVERADGAAVQVVKEIYRS
jgi:hypothetical protein